jgi:hypothetical protein
MRRFWLLTTLLAAACGSSATPSVTADASAPGPDTGQKVAADPDAAAGSPDGASTLPPVETMAGSPVRTLSARGPGACAARTLAEVIAAVHQQMPALADIQVLDALKPELGDGNRIYAFTHPGGFRLIFKRGDGDCPGGCIDNYYWYFETDAACAPVLVGQYARVYTSPGNCYTVTGKIIWGFPHAVDPKAVCGADNSPQNITGTYPLHGEGIRTECTAKKGDEPTMKVALDVQVVVFQMPGNLAQGTATVTGTGNPRIDGVPLPATFERRRLTATREVSNLPAMCPDQHNTSLELDLEAGTTGKLIFFESRTIGACPPSQDYCKGELRLDLTGK